MTGVCGAMDTCIHCIAGEGRGLVTGRVHALCTCTQLSWRLFLTGLVGVGFIWLLRVVCVQLFAGGVGDGRNSCL